MEKVIKMKPGDTLTGLFDKVKQGDTIHVKGLNWESARSEAARKNNIARLLKEIGPYEQKFSVSKVMKKDHISITYVSPVKEKVS